MSPNEPNSVTRRQLLQDAAAAGLIAASSAGHVLGAPRSGNRVLQENQRPGTRDWMLAKTQVEPKSRYRSPWIEGYCSHRSVRAGDAITFHVSTNPKSPFTIDVYRSGYYGGDGGRLVKQLGE
ncbi:MAG TPA: hypothetical protein VF175_03795, partial [Lacipirellula sp.]